MLKNLIYLNIFHQEKMSESLNKALQKAALSDKNLEEVKRLLLAGASANYYPPEDRTRDRSSLLHRVSRADIAELLIKHGASVNCENRSSETPLTRAVVDCKNFELIKTLLKHGARVDLSSRSGYTPLHYAVAKRFPSVNTIEELLKYGADVKMRDGDGYSPLGRCFTRCGKLLIKYGLLGNLGKDDLNPYVNHEGYVDNLNFFNDCECELLRLKSDDPLVYTIVTSQPKFLNRSSVPMNNAKTVKFSDRPIINYATAYPIYYDLIMDRIEPVVDRADLVKKIDEIQFYIELEADENEKKKVFLDYGAVCHMAEYLSNTDLLNLICAFDSSPKEVPMSIKEEKQIVADGSPKEVSFSNEEDEEIVAKRPKI